MTGFLLLISALVLVITIHEYCHALTAYLLGDPTAKRMGRMTLNPMAHIDPLGLIMMFLVGLGWGKPVPVNSHYFKNPKWHEAIVAVAGPISNLIIALIVAVPIKYFSASMPLLLSNFLMIVFDISIVLFAFNMLPIPPLDGSKFLQIIIPKKFEREYQTYLAAGAVYLLMFVVVDNFILSKYLGFTVLGSILDWMVVAIKSVIFLGS